MKNSAIFKDKRKVVIYLIIFMVTFYLFYKQANFKINIDLLYFSDLPAHINFAKDGKSLYSLVYLIYSVLLKFPFIELTISAFLSMVVCGTIFMTEKVILSLTGNSVKDKAFIYSVIINFVGVFYIPKVIYSFYLVGFTSNIWHNSTFLCMKLLSLIVIYEFLKIYKVYLTKINYKDMIIFSISLFMVNFVKPNFFIMFAPTMLIFLIINFLKNPRENFKNSFIFGLFVLPTIPILFFQYFILFDPNAASSGIAFGFNQIFRVFTGTPVLSVISSLLFPLIVIICNLKKVLRNIPYQFMLLLSSFGIMEFLFLYESGDRMYDANLSWGSCFSVFCLFVLATVLVLKNSSKQFLFKFILSIHLMSGLVYLIYLLQGHNFMM